MKSSLAKVLHQVYFAPMIHHVLNATKELKPSQQIVVVGHQQERVKEALVDYDLVYAEQKEQLGTGHAVLSAEELMREKGGVVMILCGDTPLITSASLQAMIDGHVGGQSVLTVMTTIVEDPVNYGRVISAADNSLLQIVEEKDASLQQKKICEIYAGIYCVDVEFLCNSLQQVGTDNQQGEVYLTDIVEIATKSGITVQKFVCDDSNEILGVNSRRELALAHDALQLRYLQELMDSGVTVYQPDTVTVESTVKVGSDTIIYPNVILRGETIIGSECVVDSLSYLDNCRIGDNVVIGADTCLKDIEIESFTRVKPCTRKMI
jgi:bifunctional UDP-N-acetylglucosamine pyrophosphorylase/glucosamine-1-phosphate N-acetyltransferase